MQFNITLGAKINLSAYGRGMFSTTEKHNCSFSKPDGKSQLAKIFHLVKTPGADQNLLKVTES